MNPSWSRTRRCSRTFRPTARSGGLSSHCNSQPQPRRTNDGGQNNHRHLPEMRHQDHQHGELVQEAGQLLPGLSAAAVHRTVPPRHRDGGAGGLIAAPVTAHGSGTTRAAAGRKVFDIMPVTHNVLHSSLLMPLRTNRRHGAECECRKIYHIAN